MEKVAHQAPVVRRENFWTGVGVGLSVLAGVAIVALGAKFGGSGWQQWAKLGGAVTSVGLVGTMGLRMSAARGLVPKRVDAQAEPPKVQELDGSQKFAQALVKFSGKFGPVASICESNIGISQIVPEAHVHLMGDGLDAAYSADNEVIQKAIGKGVPEEVEAAAHAIVEGVDEAFQGKSLSEMNDAIIRWNEQRMALVKELSQMVTSAEAWDRTDVQEKYEELLTVAGKLAEGVMRFLELKYPGDGENPQTGQECSALELRGRFLGAAEVPGYLNAVQEVVGIYRMAVERRHFSMDRAREAASCNPGTEAADYWNAASCWVGESEEDPRIFDGESRQAKWHTLHDRWCNRVVPVAQHVYANWKSPSEIDRQLNSMRRHEGVGIWGAVPLHVKKGNPACPLL